MALVESKPAVAHPLQGPLDVIPERRKVKPVKWLALVGAFFLGLQAYAFTAWIVSGPKPVPTGVTPVPSWMRPTGYTIEAVAGILFIFALYYLVVRPLRRDGRLHYDSLMFLACLTLYWSDPYVNWFRVWFSYNTASVHQWNSWLQFLPFVQLPRASQFAEAPLLTWPVYATFFVPPLMFTCFIMRKSRQRWPRLGMAGQFAIAFVCFFALDTFIEWAFIRAGVYVYWPTVKWLTLSAGHYYQFPLYEALFAAMAWTIFSAFRYIRNDKGQTLLERGIDETHSSAKQKQWLRFLAMTGAFNSVIIIVFFGIGGLLGIAAHDPVATDITSRSYMTSNTCGSGTGYACWNARDLPVPLGNKAAHVSPNGRLVGSTKP
jgi:hypothetical protein